MHIMICVNEYEYDTIVLMNL